LSWLYKGRLCREISVIRLAARPLTIIAWF
jgi:hypothetical protein